MEQDDSRVQPERPNHRGTIANDALYQLDNDIRAHKDAMRREKEYMDELKARTKFEAKDSAQMRINGFKKEFATKLQELKSDGLPYDGSQLGDIDPEQYDLDFQQTAIIMQMMGFLQQKPSQEQEQQLDDLYTLLKQDKDQNILAENLQNVLLVVSGERDPQNEVDNEEGNKRWENAGVYDQESGLFYIRQGEHAPIQYHFDLLRLNRLQQKRALKQYSHKTAPEEKTYAPKINSKTESYAERRRQKLMRGGRPVDVVEVLLHPANVEGDQDKLDRVRQELHEKEFKELTLHPKTNKRKNERMVRQPHYTTGDHNQDLYTKSKVHEKRNKTSEEYWFEKEAQECSFRPEINRGKGKDQGYVNEQRHDRMREAREKQLMRMERAREEKNFKKKMT